MNLIVQVPAFKESFTDTMDAIADQKVSHGVSVTHEAWITPSCPDRRQCGTWQQAAQHPVFEAYEAPTGKLSARNAAHDHAVASGADAFVQWDADAPPDHSGVLKALTAPLSGGSVVGVNGSPRAPPTVLGRTVDALVAATRAVRPYMHGQCSLVTAEGWDQAGPFKESIDQTRVFNVWLEEEKRFYDRLRQAGRVVRAREATVYNDTRRWECRFSKPWSGFGRPVDDWCANRGITSFIPDHYERNKYAADGPPARSRRRMAGRRDAEGPRDDAGHSSGNAYQRRRR